MIEPKVRVSEATLREYRVFITKYVKTMLVFIVPSQSSIALKHFTAYLYYDNETLILVSILMSSYL